MKSKRSSLGPPPAMPGAASVSFAHKTKRAEAPLATNGKRLPPLNELFLVGTQVLSAVLSGHRCDFAPCTHAAALPAVMELVLGTLRKYGRGDFYLTQALHDNRAPVPLRALWLLALHRLESRPLADAPTTTHQAVIAASQLAPKGKDWKKVTNFVLRQYLRHHKEWSVAMATVPDAQWNHPQWWIARLQSDYPAAWQEQLSFGNQQAGMTLRINRLRCDVDTYLRHLAPIDPTAKPLGDMAVMLSAPRKVEMLPGYHEGWFSVQDWSAQQAAALLEVEDGMRVLDACAAPGGKASHLLEIAGNIQLMLVEKDPARMARLLQNFARLGLATTAHTTHIGACEETERWWDGRAFDRILLDVPCSASGVVRHHPDSKWLRRAADIAAFARQQQKSLRALWPLLKVGGRLLYATCSLFHEENEVTVMRFLQHHPDARLREHHLAGQRLMTAESDGFYYALLEKTGSAVSA